MNLEPVVDKHGNRIPCLSCGRPTLVKLPLVKAYESEVTGYDVRPKPSDFRCHACGLEGPQR
jgi:hypothetical protein